MNLRKRSSNAAASVEQARRSNTMRAVRSKETQPELLVRHLVKQLRRRPRVNDNTLPGTPDLVFPSLRKAIFVHGCFWHGHSCARGSRVPKTNREYWVRKVARNRLRDAAVCQVLRHAGWQVLIVWECRTRDQQTLIEQLRRFLH